MSNQEFFLSDFISVKHGFAFKGDFITTEENENCLLTPGNFMIGGGFKSDKFKYFSGDIPQDYILKEDDLIITMTDLSKQGDTLGYSALVPSIYGKKMLHNQRIGLVEFKNNELDKHYLYFLLRSHEYRSYILGCSTGSTVRHTSPSKIVSFKFVKPDLETQKKIANKLLSLEKKIELNTQINQTLEQIAQALFKSWFVDFDPVRAKVQALSDGLSLEQAELAAMQTISGKTPEELTALSQTQPDRYAELAETAKAFPCEMVEVDGGEVPKGWEVKPLGDLISFVKGKKPKSVSPKQKENMLPHILTSSLEGKYNEFCESNKLVTIEYHNTIMLMDGSNSGRIAIGHNGVIGSTLAKINLDNNKLWAVIYQFLKHKEADIQANTTGTTIPHTDKNRVNNYLMVIPDNFLLEKFTELFDNSLLKIISNRNQIISLETTRDLLLPRLLNGEIQL